MWCEGLNWIYLTEHRVQLQTFVTMVIRSGVRQRRGVFLNV
jgi:hypothetical protein